MSLGDLGQDESRTVLLISVLTARRDDGRRPGDGGVAGSGRGVPLDDDDVGEGGVEGISGGHVEAFEDGVDVLVDALVAHLGARAVRAVLLQDDDEDGALGRVGAGEAPDALKVLDASPEVRVDLRAVLAEPLLGLPAVKGFVVCHAEISVGRLREMTRYSA